MLQITSYFNTLWTQPWVSDPVFGSRWVPEHTITAELSSSSGVRYPSRSVLVSGISQSHIKEMPNSECLLKNRSVTPTDLVFTAALLLGKHLDVRKDGGLPPYFGKVVSTLIMKIRCKFHSQVWSSLLLSEQRSVGFIQEGAAGSWQSCWQSNSLCLPVWGKLVGFRKSLVEKSINSHFFELQFGFRNEWHKDHTCTIACWYLLGHGQFPGYNGRLFRYKRSCYVRGVNSSARILLSPPQTVDCLWTASGSPLKCSSPKHPSQRNQLMDTKDLPSTVPQDLQAGRRSSGAVTHEWLCWDGPSQWRTASWRGWWCCMSMGLPHSLLLKLPWMHPPFSHFLKHSQDSTDAAHPLWHPLDCHLRHEPYIALQPTICALQAKGGLCISRITISALTAQHAFLQTLSEVCRYERYFLNNISISYILKKKWIFSQPTYSKPKEMLCTLWGYKGAQTEQWNWGGKAKQQWEGAAPCRAGAESK